MYDRLFNVEDPLDVEEGGTFLDHLNPDSLQVLEGAKLEPALAEMPVGENVQFERKGYFVKDPDSTDERPVFNLTISLRDTWAKMQSG